MAEPDAGAGRPIAARLALLLLVLLLAACGRAGGDGLADLFFAEEAGPRLPYEVRFEGPLDAELLAALEAASTAVQQQERPPADELQLARRAERDLPRLEAALRGLGYYRSRAEVRVEPVARPAEPARRPGFDEPPAGAPPPSGPAARVVFLVEPGPRYRLDERRIEIDGPAHGFVPPRPGQLGLDRGEPAIAQKVLDAEAALVRAAQEAGHALARAGPRSVVVDHDRQTMEVTLRIEPGPVVRYGPVRFEGGEGIAERYLRRLVPVEENARFDPRHLERGRDALAASGLFSAVRPRPAEKLDPDGRLPVTFELVQRKHRSIGGGVGYVTDEGPNVRVFWEHRNILGAGERFRADAGVSPIRQSAEASFRKPAFLVRRQALVANAVALAESLDAYDGRSLKLAAGVERRLRRQLEGALGVAYRFADIEDRRGRERFALLSLPAWLAWDGSDDLFDPSRGARLRAEAAPYADTLGLGTRFLKGRLVATAYHPIWNRPRLVLAGRAATGSIAGAERDVVPADERWYAGGGGSVRGIPFQKAGPLDRHGDPVGGRSVLELSAELRLNLTEQLGLVGFIDGGNAFVDPIPDLGGGLRWGAGLGLRYATPVGPLRLDVAVPIDKKPEVDDPFQLYLSLGQAF
ncbi:MAG: autotransporter assembly complex protein TamA [Geminicoccaceae bacterium]|nr:autotransporter assembly complex protein TamA [Geminicoccaceae bacterium]MCX8102445.1 autotransporter assembly complex protein TamA [Geminicoccaceae bacterium]